MNILILGAGAVGSLFGGFLARAGHRVVFLGRRKNNSAIRNNGLKINGIWGDHCVRNIDCFEDLDRVRKQVTDPFDYAILSVKSYDTRTMVSNYVTTFPEPATIISLQNGLENLETIADIAGPDHTIGGRVITGIEYQAPGRIQVTVSAANPVLGQIKASARPKAVAAAELFSASGIKTDHTDTIRTFIWEKVLYNCALNALSTILNINYGKLLLAENAKALITDIITEAYTVIQKENVTVDIKTPEKYLERLFTVLIPRTAEHHPSMLQDINNHKKTEIDALNGAIVNLAKKHGLTAPCNETISAIIRAKELL